MKIGILFFMSLIILGHVYVYWHLWNILPLGKVSKGLILAFLSLGFLFLVFNFGIGLERLSLNVAEAVYGIGTSSIFVLLYAVMLFLVLDLGRAVHLVPSEFLHNSWRGTITVVALIVGIFVYGNVHYNNKVRQELTLKSEKTLDKPLRIVMLTDLHLGYHNRRAEFSRWVDMVNAEKPDLILIAGDIIDVSVHPLIEENVAEEFRRFNAPVYACLGNHEYYSGDEKAERFYRDARIHLLRDSVATVMGINIVGRDDRTNFRRAKLSQIMANADTSRYTILLDHQPYNLEEAEHAGVDFQLSGHTHYGQVFPISWIVDAMYEKAYGELTKGKTQYFVTSGIGIWGGKFRIGTRSEYVVCTIEN